MWVLLFVSKGWLHVLICQTNKELTFNSWPPHFSTWHWNPIFLFLKFVFMVAGVLWGSPLDFKYFVTQIIIQKKGAFLSFIPIKIGNFPLLICQPPTTTLSQLDWYPVFGTKEKLLRFIFIALVKLRTLLNSDNKMSSPIRMHFGFELHTSISTLHHRTGQNRTHDRRPQVGVEDQTRLTWVVGWKYKRGVAAVVAVAGLRCWSLLTLMMMMDI